MRDLRRSAEHDPGYPAILFVHQGTAEQGEDWFARFWPEAHLYQLFGIGQASVGQVASLGAVACIARAVLKGNSGGMVVGDSKLMPGLFAIESERIIWQHDFRHVGDHPDFADIPTLIEQAANTAR